MSARRGLTLLETMVALVILGLVSLAYLELFGGTVRASESVRHWSQAVAYAEDAMEQLKVVSESEWERGSEDLGGGFARRVQTRRWRDNLQVVSVIVALPGGGQYSLSRLMEPW
jgi:prepilin-type N-terminal cleavage/methylation domain-containing protein